MLVPEVEARVDVLQSNSRSGGDGADLVDTAILVGIETHVLKRDASLKADVK